MVLTPAKLKKRFFLKLYARYLIQNSSNKQQTLIFIFILFINNLDTARLNLSPNEAISLKFSALWQKTDICLRCIEFNLGEVDLQSTMRVKAVALH